MRWCLLMVGDEEESARAIDRLWKEAAEVQAWIGDHPALVTSLTMLSALMFVGSLLLGPWLLVRLPPDYFLYRRPPGVWFREWPVLRWTFVALKNLLGLVLVLVGTVMIVTPGQGILTIFIGSTLLNIPGKQRFELWLVSRPRVLRALNWLRMKAKRPPFEVRGGGDAGDQAGEAAGGGG